MKPQQVLSSLALVCISLGIAFGLAEVGVRLLERFDLLSENRGTVVFPKGPYRGQYRPSKNKRLLVELDPDGPLVNADGFRDRDYPIERSDALRIVAVGDSVTFGRGIPLQEAWSEVLEERLNSGTGPGVEVLNLGVGGYNTRQEVEWYEVKGRKYAPDLIIVAFVLNDCLPDNWNLQRGPKPQGAALRRAPSALAHTAHATEIQLVAFPAALLPAVAAENRVPVTEKQPSGFDRSRLLVLLRDRLLHDPYAADEATRRRILGACNNPDLWGQIELSFRRLARIGRRDGTSVLVVVFPMIIGYEDYPFTALHRRVIDAARRFGLDTLDLLDAFSRDDVASLRHTPMDPVHPSRAGHRLAAETIYAYLQSERLLERRAAGRRQDDRGSSR